MNLVSISEEVPNQAIVGAHSIDQFAPEIESVASSGLVTVERNTMLSSVKKSAGSIIALGITAYDTAKEMKEDRATGDGLQKAAKQTITVAEQTEEFVADNAIMDVGLALAPETYGQYRRRTRRDCHSQYGRLTFCSRTQRRSQHGNCEGRELV